MNGVGWWVQMTQSSVLTFSHSFFLPDVQNKELMSYSLQSATLENPEISCRTFSYMLSHNTLKLSQMLVPFLTCWAKFDLLNISNVVVFYSNEIKWRLFLRLDPSNLARVSIEFKKRSMSQTVLSLTPLSFLL